MKTEIAVKHTPTPWKFDKSLSNIVSECPRNGGMAITAEIPRFDFMADEMIVEAEANAAFIVRAVNSHEELLKIAKAVIVEFEMLDQSRLTSMEKRLASDAREAIAKAEGK